MTLVAANEREQIAQKVQEALDRHQPRNYRISVNKQAIYKEDDWYHIVVVTPDDVRDRDFYDALAEAELELNEKSAGQEYLLVPAIVS